MMSVTVERVVIQREDFARCPDCNGLARVTWRSPDGHFEALCNTCPQVRTSYWHGQTQFKRISGQFTSYETVRG